jgi:hypothetical protein
MYINIHQYSDSSSRDEHSTRAAAVSLPLDELTLSLRMGIFGIRAPSVETKLLSVKPEVGPLQTCWMFSDL